METVGTVVGTPLCAVVVATVVGGTGLVAASVVQLALGAAALVVAAVLVAFATVVYVSDGPIAMQMGVAGAAVARTAAYWLDWAPLALLDAGFAALGMIKSHRRDDAMSETLDFEASNPGEEDVSGEETPRWHQTMEPHAAVRYVHTWLAGIAGGRNLSTTLRHRRLRFTEQSLLLWMWQVG